MADLSPVPDGAPRRGRVPLRDVAEVVLPPAILLLVLVNVALTIGGGGDRPFEEWGFVTILSSVALATAGVLSLVCFACHPEPRSFGRWFWALAGVGFLFFAVDELLQGHEKAGDKLEIQYGAAPLFRNWNDAIAAAQATRSSWSARWPTSALRRGPTPRGTASPASGGSPVP